MHLPVGADPAIARCGFDERLGHAGAGRMRVGHEAADPVAQDRARGAIALGFCTGEGIRQQECLDAGAIGRFHERRGGRFLVDDDQIVGRRGAADDRHAVLAQHAVIALGVENLDVDVELPGSRPHGLGDEIPEHLAGLAGIDEGHAQPLIGRCGAILSDQEKRQKE